MSQPENPQDQSQRPQPASSDLGNELRELGQQLEQAVRTALESERAKQVQSDIASGMKEIGAQLQTAVKAIQDNPRVQQFVQRGEQIVDQTQHTKVAQDLQDTLARGITLLNEQLAGFVSRMRQEGDPPTDTSGTSTTGTAGTTGIGTGTTGMGTDAAGIGTGTTGMGTDTTGTTGTTGTAGIGTDTTDTSATTGETTRLDPNQG